MTEGKAKAMKNCCGFNVLAVPYLAGRDPAPMHPVPNFHEMKVLVWWKILLLAFSGCKNRALLSALLYFFFFPKSVLKYLNIACANSLVGKEGCAHALGLWMSPAELVEQIEVRWMAVLKILSWSVLL